MRLVTGDELGNIKVLNATSDRKLELKSSQALDPAKKPRSIQKLVIQNLDQKSTVSAAYEDGTVSTFSVNSDESLEEVTTWNEPRMKTGERFVGFSGSKRGIFSCTSNGALRLAPKDETESTSTAILPTRLRDWQLSSSIEKFVYGGEEVELSVWDTEKVFTAPIEAATSNAATKKRKRSEALFPAEVWRAKNVPNDELGLRQPVGITSVAYISPSSESHILAGTQLGHLRRYDTRAARRPVSDWKNVGKLGGVKTVAAGSVEHEAFVGDGSSNLFVIDLRNGGVLYAYRGISGAVSSMESAGSSLLASTAQDHFVRLHSTFPPPPGVGQQQEAKGQVLDKMYMKALPTVLAWDRDYIPVSSSVPVDEDNDEDVWDGMEEVDDEDDDSHTKRRRK